MNLRQKLTLGLFAFLLGLLVQVIFRPQNVYSGAQEIQIVALLNAQRKLNGLKPLLWNEKLANAAKAKAADMVADGYWSHSSPDGLTPWYFIKQAGYKYRSAGENLARGYSSPEDTVTAWMNSQGHKDNILSLKYKEIGVTMVNNNGSKLVVAMFGSR